MDWRNQNYYASITFENSAPRSRRTRQSLKKPTLLIFKIHLLLFFILDGHTYHVLLYTNVLHSNGCNHTINLYFHNPELHNNG